MSYHHRPHELRLAISSEADALISGFGGEAHAEACRRAEEASNDFLAHDWSVVASTIARRSARRSSVLDALLSGRENAETVTRELERPLRAVPSCAPARLF